MGLAGVVWVVGSLSLVEYVFGINLGMDDILFNDGPGAVQTVDAGRLAPQTAIGFFFIATALLLPRGWRATREIHDVLIICTLVVSLFSLFGYLYDAAE